MTAIYNDKQWEFIYELHLYGYTYIELAEWLGISRDTIRYNLCRLGFKACAENRPPLSTYTKKFVALGGHIDARSISD